MKESRRTGRTAILSGMAVPIILSLVWATGAFAKPPAPEKARLRAIYAELIGINTTATEGDTVKAAEAMAAHLRAAGFAPEDVQVLVQAPRKGNLVARLRGTGQKRPLLLLAHIDVVDAKPEDWSYPPFALTEKGGYFYGRGTMDDKAMAAIFVHNLIRFKEEGYKPERDIIIALTTDEETPDSGFNGVQWLIREHRALVDAEFAINEGGSGVLVKGRPYMHTVQTSEKIYANFRLEVTNTGGHSSVPAKDNAIYRLAGALTRLQTFDFPIMLNDTTRAYYARMAALEKGRTASDMKTLASGIIDPEAVARLSADARHNAQLRTTCVATRLEAGHADNALPQRAAALVNCRIFPGFSASAVRKTLTDVVADKEVSVSEVFLDVASAPSPVSGEVIAAVEKLTAEMWPGIPVVPSMSAGATDSRYLRNAGIPTYGTSGLFLDRDDNRAHGKDERLGVEAFYTGATYQYRLVKMLAGGN